MQYRRNTLILVIITLACWLGLGVAQAADFSAQVVSRTGSQEVKGKIYLQGEKMRQEFSAPEGLSINIFRPDKQVMWVIMPAQKMYMEMPFGQSDLGKTMQMPQDKAKMKLLGTETVNGYETEKYETTVKGRGREVKHYIWVAKKLGVPIKMTSADGSFSMEYRDIKEGNVPAAKFEVPPGYQKMTMPPGMPQGMPQRR
ncbi:MAG: DUF4412 domain-containing protein [Syntrophales bacterium]|nr:DUF4412 domain-containing protein [Syntrophales bacterium]